MAGPDGIETKDYGLLDMLDDDTSVIRGKVTHSLCKNGESKDPMRRFVGGIVAWNSWNNNQHKLIKAPKQQFSLLSLISLLRHLVIYFY